MQPQYTPNPPQKQCYTCKDHFPRTAEYFHRSTQTSDGFISACKDCTNRKGRARRSAYRKPKKVLHPGFKQCKKCKEWKPAPAESFHKLASAKDGLQPICKECRTVKARTRPQSTVVDGRKDCTKCGQSFPATAEYFYRQQSHKTGFNPVCKVCFVKLYIPIVGDSRPRARKQKSVEIVCPECGKTFKRKPSHVKPGKTTYCSKACAYEGYGKRHGGENSPIYTTVQLSCDFCGAMFGRIGSYKKRNPKGKFCSNACYGKWRTANLTGESSARWNGGLVAVPCLQCGADVSIVPSRIRKPGNFCSQECYGIWRTSNIIGDESPLWKGGRLPYYGVSWKRNRRKALERDKHTCQHCGATKAESGREPDVHHRTPFRLFGIERHEEANHLDNLISLCKTCHGNLEERNYVGSEISSTAANGLE